MTARSLEVPKTLAMTLLNKRVSYSDSSFVCRLQFYAPIELVHSDRFVQGRAWAMLKSAVSGIAALAAEAVLWAVFLQAAAGDGMQRDAVRRRRAHGPGRVVLCKIVRRQCQRKSVGIASSEARLGCKRGFLLGKKDADIVRPERRSAVAQGRSFRGAQRSEQQEKSGEMKGAMTHQFNFR